jgi:hypothetical protein
VGWAAAPLRTAYNPFAEAHDGGDLLTPSEFRGTSDDRVFRHRIVFVAGPERADALHAVAPLPPRRHRPSRRAPEPRNELPPFHSITLRRGHRWRPGAPAVPIDDVLNVVYCTTGKSAALTPLRMLPV